MDRAVEFDRIAPLYDETRRPPTDIELATLAELLGTSRTVLDAGVGTGRFALPLRARGFEVVGLDLSVEMMRRARAKGLGALVRADVRRLPMKPKSLDGSFMAHVLQLLPDPRPVLAELGRVSRRTVVVLLPEWSDHRPEGGWRELRDRYRAIASELGYSLPERPPRYRHSLDELRAISPPSTVREVSTPPGMLPSSDDWIARWAARSLGTYPIPLEVHAEIVRRLRAEGRGRPMNRAALRTERFLSWDATDLWPGPRR